MEDIAYQYASKVVNGEIIASKKVIKACKRHLRDLKRMDDEDFPYVYLPDKANAPRCQNGKAISVGRFSKIHFIKSIWLEKKV